MNDVVYDSHNSDDCNNTDDGSDSTDGGMTNMDDTSMYDTDASNSSHYNNSNDNYTDNYKRRSKDPNHPDVCQYCANCGSNDWHNYVCAKNPYNLVFVSFHGHCDDFSKTRRQISRFEKFLLIMNRFEFRNLDAERSK